MESHQDSDSEQGSVDEQQGGSMILLLHVDNMSADRFTFALEPLALGMGQSYF